MDPSVAPSTVLAGQTQDENLNAATGRRPARPLAPGSVRVTTAYEVTVPPQNRVRVDDQVQLPQLGPRQPVEKCGQERTIRRGDARPVDLSLQDGKLVAQRQHLDVLVYIAHRQQTYEGEHARHGEIGQSQQHDQPA
jgi:hypothetical protein